MEAGMRRGRAVHLATQYLDEGRLDPESVSQAIYGYVLAYKRFVAAVKPQMVLIEQPVVHQDFLFAGTLDRVCKIDGLTFLLDIKTGSVAKTAGPQTAAYAKALESCLGVKVDRRAVVLLNEVGDYQFRRMPDDHDWPVFVSALTIHNWRSK